MKEKIKRFIPKSWLTVFRNIRKSRVIKKIQLLNLFRDDYVRISTSAFGLKKQQTYGNLISRITFHAHSIEKGLSHQNIRLGFGRRAIQGLFDALKAYQDEGFPLGDVRFQMGISVLKQYILFHDAKGFDISETKQKFEPYREMDPMPFGGIRDLRKEAILSSTHAEFTEFVQNRFSTRDYSDQPVDLNLIDQAIEISMKTPSICNRQPWEVMVIQNKSMINKVLEHQGGLTNQGSNIGVLLIVMSKSEYLSGPEERNQGYIDGGMFAMTLTYALHRNGLASCPLNADFDHKTDKALRKLLNVNSHDNFIVMLSVGNYMDHYKVPQSHRDNFKSITKYIK